jgi:hypothetical protein
VKENLCDARGVSRRPRQDIAMDHSLIRFDAIVSGHEARNDK